MGNRLNSAFLSAYIELDKVCCLKFGAATGGITEYINRLITARFAPDRDDVLPRLVKYRNIRNRMAHEEGAFGKIDEIAKADVRWIQGFKKAMQKKRDPISLYLRKTRRYARRRRLRKVLIIAALLILVLGAAAAFIMSKIM